MLNFRHRSDWEFETSSSGGAGLGVLSVGAGNLYFIPPDGGEAIYGYRSAGAGLSLGAALPDDMSVSFADKSLTNRGRLWITPDFAGEDLSPNDLTGFCTIQEVSSALGSGQLMFLGIDLASLAPETARDLFSISLIGDITEIVLDKLDLDWPDIMKSKANAALMVGGFGFGTNLFGATGSLGYVYPAGMKSAKVVNQAAPRQDNYLPIKSSSNGKETLMEITSDVLFDFDKDTLKPSAEKVLLEVAKRIKTLQPLLLEVSGYADSIGNDGYNLGLSYRRANRVKDWLVAKGGVAASKIVALGFGEYIPKASNLTSEGRAKNRRVEIRMFK